MCKFIVVDYKTKTYWMLIVFFDELWKYSTECYVRFATELLKLNRSIISIVYMFQKACNKIGAYSRIFLV